MALCTKSHILVLLNLDTLPLNRQQQDPRPENHLKKLKSNATKGERKSIKKQGWMINTAAFPEPRGPRSKIELLHPSVIEVDTMNFNLL